MQSASGLIDLKLTISPYIGYIDSESAVFDGTKLTIDNHLCHISSENVILDVTGAGNNGITSAANVVIENKSLDNVIGGFEQPFLFHNIAGRDDPDVVNAAATGGSGGASAFTDLTDTPGTLGTANQQVRVNAAGTALEFFDDNKSFTDLTDTPGTLGSTGQVPAVNAAGTALEFVTISGGSGGAANNTFNARLTSVSGNPVPTTNQTAITTIYLTPYNGNQISLYNGTSWSTASFSEIALPLAGLLANTNYDIFVYDNAGSATLEAVAWTDNITRAISLTTQDGIYVKSGDSTRRYVGTIRTTSVAGQTEDTAKNRLLWNLYNQIIRKFYFVGNGSYVSNIGFGNWQPWLNDTSYTLSFVVGVSTNPVIVRFDGLHSVSGSGTAAIGLGFDGANPVQATNHTIGSNSTGTVLTVAAADFNRIVADGFHTLQAMQSPGSSSTTFYGLVGSTISYGVNGFLMG